MINKTFFLNLLVIILLVMMQTFIFNRILFFNNKIFPQVFIIWIIFNTSKNQRNAFLIYSFFLGLLLDLFTFSGGINTFACVFLAQCHSFIIRFISNKDMEKDYYSFKEFNLLQIIFYILLSTFLFNFIYYTEYLLFFREFVFNLKEFIEKVLLSTVITSLFIFVIYSFFKNIIDNEKV